MTQSDDVMPNGGDYFSIREPLEQELDRKLERAKTLEALPIIRKTIAHLDQKIADRDKLSAIKPDLAKDPLMHQKVCEVNEMIKIALIEERDELEELLKTYKR